jgi:redox-sensing transcriptional repressor
MAGFDIRDEIVNTKINNIPVYHADEFIERNQKTIKAEIGVLTVPADIAQQTADYLIEGGIRGIWNFTPFRIRVPEGIVLQNTSIYAHLAVMFNRLKQLPK